MSDLFLCSIEDTFQVTGRGLMVAPQFAASQSNLTWRRCRGYANLSRIRTGSLAHQFMFRAARPRGAVAQG